MMMEKDREYFEEKLKTATGPDRVKIERQIALLDEAAEVYRQIRSE